MNGHVLLTPGSFDALPPEGVDRLLDALNEYGICGQEYDAVRDRIVLHLSRLPEGDYRMFLEGDPRYMEARVGVEAP